MRNNERKFLCVEPDRDYAIEARQVKQINV